MGSQALVFGAMMGMFGSLVLTAVALTVREKLGERRQARQKLASWAEGRGLDGAGGRVTGSVDGCPVEIRMLLGSRYEDYGGSTSIRVAVTDTIPGGLRITPEPQTLLGALDQDIQVGDRLIDDRCEIQARDPDLARAVMGDPAVRAAIKPLLSRRARLWLSRYQLEGRFDGRFRSDMDLCLDQLLELATVLERSPARSFRELEDRKGWSPGGRSALRADGEVDGLTVRVRYRDDAGPPHTAVRVEVPGLEPGDLRVTLPEYGGDGDGLSTGDPIVDRLLWVDGANAERVTRLLRDDDLRAALLEVVHGHPGSAVRGGAVLLAVPGYDLSRIDHRIALATSLANALRAGLEGPADEGD